MGMGICAEGQEVNGDVGIGPVLELLMVDDGGARVLRVEVVWKRGAASPGLSRAADGHAAAGLLKAGSVPSRFPI
ncbi:hypothetical protein J3R03_008748 [Actinoplanes couchii]|uniref:Uncharacterized protein n=1 Tax=Actinoplanes couchii TaxID=403638 RepID=A0ABQ3XT52_9ACTN|nr:hypothetical protein [Actinoplanes couchii]GID61689.1 hypothetical protein Aco03nite_100930 [Actinoplanes couchii]